MASSTTLEQEKGNSLEGIVNQIPPDPPSDSGSGGGGGSGSGGPGDGKSKAAPVNLDGDASQYTSVTRWIVLIAVMLGTLLEVLDTSIVNVSLTQMMGNLGATLNEIGWVSTGYIVANVIVLPLTGWLSSYFGRRRYLTGSIILFTIASFLCGHSTSLFELVAFRILQGAGGAALLSSAQTTLIEVFPRKQLAMVQAIFTMGVVFAPTVGPTVGGYITDNYSWPWIFYVNIPIGIAAGFLVWTFLKDSTFQQKPKGGVDFLGIGLLAVGLGCLQTLLEKGNEEGWMQSNLIIILSVVAVITLYSFVVWELQAPNPAVNLRVLKNVGFTVGTFMAMVLGFGLYGGVFILPIFLQQVRGFSPTQTGMVFFPGGLATVLVLPFVGKAMGRFQARYLVLIGSLIAVYAFWQLSYLSADSGVSDVYIPLIIRGAGLGMLFLPLSIAAITALKPQEIPGGTGLYNLARQLGGSLGIALLATYVDNHSKLTRGQLMGNISALNPIAQSQLGKMQGYMISKGYAPQVAHQMAIESLNGRLSQQAAILSFNGGFQIISACFLVGIPVFFLLPKKIAAPRGGGGH